MFQDPTSTAVGGGTGITGWRTNGTDQAPSPASALLVAGPTQGDVNVAAEPFLVTANGILAAFVTVTPSAAGGTVSWSPTSAVLTSGGSVSFVPTPSTIGTLTFTFSASGLSSAIAVYESESPTLVVDLDTTWMINIDPATAFEGSHGTIPAGVVAHDATPDPNYSPALLSKVGVTNRPRTTITLGDGGGDLTYNLDQDHGADSTTTTILPCNLDPTYPMLSRVADPDNGAKWSFRHEGDKTRMGWTSGNKWRIFLQPTLEAQRSDDWGCEHWLAFGFRLDADWADASRGPYHHLIDIHCQNNGLMGGSDFDLDIQPGGGAADGIQFQFTVKRYKLSTWPQNQDLKNKTNHEFTTTMAGGFQTLTRYWGVLHWKTGNGFPDYPGYDPAVGGPTGSPVWGTYGSTDPNDPFVELFIAEGNNDPFKLFRWDNDFAVANGIANGFWGAPVPTTSSAAVKKYQPYVQLGLYTSSRFEPTAQIGNVQGLYTKGYVQWRAKDVPGINEVNVLNWFRTARG